MITRLTLRNFKGVQEQTYEFTQFDVLAGGNNSGKSTVLQALAIWQFCVDEFSRSKRTGKSGIQIVLPNFTAVPVPEFNLLWNRRTGKKAQEFILIKIVVEWSRPDGSGSFGIDLRYHSPQTIYAVPQGGWQTFRESAIDPAMPRIAYVPSFSGLETAEKWLDSAPIRQQVGKGQPGSVLRNLLLRVRQPELRAGDSESGVQAWQELASTVQRWFSVDLDEPAYDSGRDVHIGVRYRQNGHEFDIIAGGSGFHQTLTLLAFLHGYRPTTILLDEPDAHLHMNLQRRILDYFRLQSGVTGTQFLIATHAEEFVRGVSVGQIVSLLSHAPRRVTSAAAIVRAMADVFE